MATPFTRTMRSLDADNFRTAIIGLVILVFLFVMWSGWFIFATIGVYQTSEQAKLVDNRHVEARFPSNAWGNLRRGQTGIFRPDQEKLEPIPVVVLQVKQEPKTKVVQSELSLRTEKMSSSPQETGISGRVEVEIERVSPAILALRNSGLLNVKQNKSK